MSEGCRGTRPADSTFRPGRPVGGDAAARVMIAE